MKQRKTLNALLVVSTLALISGCNGNDRPSGDGDDSSSDAGSSDTSTGDATSDQGTQGSDSVSTSAGDSDSQDSNSDTNSDAGSSDSTTTSTADSTSEETSDSGSDTTTTSTDETTTDTDTTPMGFTKNVRVTDDSGAEQSEMAMGVGPDGLVVAGWLDYRSGLRCGFAYSTDKGDTWSENFFIAPRNGGISGDPAAAIDDDGTMYVACQDYGSSEIAFQRSSDKGQTWTPRTVITDSIDKPYIAANVDDKGNGMLHLTWIDGRYRRSMDRGDTWEPELPIGGVGQGTTIGLGNTGLVHIGYHTGGSLRYLKSTDWGATLSSGRNLTSMGSLCFNNCFPRNYAIVGGSSDPTGQVVALTWGGGRDAGDGSEDVWVVISEDAGETWSEPLRANDDEDGAYQVHPWAAVDAAGQVHVAWTDLRKGAKVNSTMYAMAPSAAEGFGANIEITDSNEGTLAGFYGDYKSVMVYGNDVYVVWSDPRDGDLNVYFSRGVKMAKGKKYDARELQARPKGPIVGTPLDLKEIAKEKADSFQRGDAWFFPKPAAFVNKPESAVKHSLATLALHTKLYKIGTVREWLMGFDTRKLRTAGKGGRLAPMPAVGPAVGPAAKVEVSRNMEIPASVLK